MNDALDKTADPAGLNFVMFYVSGWRVAFEARQIRAASLTSEGRLGNGIEARLGFSPATSKASATPRQCLRIKSANDDTNGETEILVDGPVDLVCLPLAAIHPLPPLLSARTRLHGLRALALEPETSARHITLLFDSACLTDDLEKERDSLAKDADALLHHQKQAPPPTPKSAMTVKSEPPTKQAPKPKTPPSHQNTPNPLREADSRWQRTARYGWDKGGSNGGRK